MALSVPWVLKLGSVTRRRGRSSSMGLRESGLVCCSPEWKRERGPLYPSRPTIGR
jgi:hypothetical protein